MEGFVGNFICIGNSAVWFIGISVGDVSILSRFFSFFLLYDFVEPAWFVLHVVFVSFVDFATFVAFVDFAFVDSVVFIDFARVLAFVDFVVLGKC